MSENKKYRLNFTEDGGSAGSEFGYAALCERLESIASALEGIERGLRNLAMMSGLDRIVKNPELMKEFGKSVGTAVAAVKEPPNG